METRLLGSTACIVWSENEAFFSAPFWGGGAVWLIRSLGKPKRWEGAHFGLTTRKQPSVGYDWIRGEPGC